MTRFITFLPLLFFPMAIASDQSSSMVKDLPPAAWPLPSPQCDHVTPLQPLSIPSKVCLGSSITWFCPSSPAFPLLFPIPTWPSFPTAPAMLKYFHFLDCNQHDKACLCLCSPSAWNTLPSSACLENVIHFSRQQHVIHHLLVTLSLPPYCVSSALSLLGPTPSGADVSIASTTFHYAVYSRTWQCIWVIVGAQ